MHGWPLLTVIILVVALVTVGHAYWFPLQRCPRCKDRVSGSGRGSTSKAFNRRCRACNSTGTRVRPLTRLLHAVTGMPVRDRKEK